MQIKKPPKLNYCKIHPFIFQPYPCLICQQEIEDHNRKLVEFQFCNTKKEKLRSSKPKR